MNNQTRYSDTRILEACEGIIERKGYTIEERDYSPLISFVAYSEDWETILFIACESFEGVEREEEPFCRWEVEEEMFRYLMNARIDSKAVTVRFDRITLFVTDDSRALARYHTAALD